MQSLCVAQTPETAPPMFTRQQFCAAPGQVSGQLPSTAVELPASSPAAFPPSSPAAPASLLLPLLLLAALPPLPLLLLAALLPLPLLLLPLLLLAALLPLPLLLAAAPPPSSDPLLLLVPLPLPAPLLPPVAPLSAPPPVLVPASPLLVALELPQAYMAAATVPRDSANKTLIDLIKDLPII
jgi:hypothetical protein